MSVLKKPFDEICSFFNIDPEKSIKCMVLERARRNREYPIVYFISYFNPSIPFTGGEDFSQPLYGILENKYDIIVKIVKGRSLRVWLESPLQKSLISSPVILYW